VLIPNAPLGLITTAVQALAGLLLPSATVFLLLLCNDPAVLGPWVNKPWLNALASLILGVLLMLSLVLVVTTIFPSIDIVLVIILLAGVLLAGLLALGVQSARSQRTAQPPPHYSESEKESWRMPPLALLTRPVWSRTTRFAMVALSGYLVAAVLLLLVKAVELATGH
jgi:hypothetical protein